MLLPALVAPVDESLLARIAEAGNIRCFEGGADALWDNALVAWDPFSGVAIPHDALRRVLLDSLQWWGRADVRQARTLPLGAPSPVRERSASTRPTSGRFRGVVLGLGNYAKATLIPHTKRYVDVVCVHELEPTQIGRVDRPPWAADTSPVLRDDERYDVYFIAGYHHTHASLAAEGLRRGGWVVCEKPLVTTEEELHTLLDAVREHPARFFACFQMRYGPLWQYAQRDLGVRLGEPIHYQCIVFESPVPRHHWYNWPNSGSRLVSNGCHWLDHFLFLNGFPDVKHAGVRAFGNHDLSVNVELANGAVMNMLLTQHGSPRIGIQEHVELRANGTTIRVDNSSFYSAEGPTRYRRRARSRRLVSHETMYETICRKIVAGEPGDTLESIERSCRLLLDLEAQLREAGPAESPKRTG